MSKNLHQQLYQAWEIAIERAVEQTARAQEVASAQLNAAAGIPIQSGVNVGGAWGVTHHCNKGEGSSYKLGCGG